MPQLRGHCVETVWTGCSLEAQWMICNSAFARCVVALANRSHPYLFCWLWRAAHLVTPLHQSSLAQFRQPFQALEPGFGRSWHFGNLANTGRAPKNLFLSMA